MEKSALLFHLTVPPGKRLVLSTKKEIIRRDSYLQTTCRKGGHREGGHNRLWCSGRFRFLFRE
ncbi:MAG: hypothetical protein D6679_06355 [Candidatus Hydrogenedentota bacterium]|nr:MAG: hypothetical protein D6679_06355 [Candidatus Hydrogenedentota bacterium]